MVPDRGHGSHWCVVVAVVGLAALLIAGEAAQAEDSSPVAQRGEAIQSGPPTKPTDEQRPANGPGWHPTLLQAEQASKAECTDGDDCRSEQRDYSDLRAQWQAALAAKGQAQFALVQTIMMIFGTGIAAMGTWFVVQTLQETRSAVEKAAEANRIARESYLADQRPWVVGEPDSLGDLHINDVMVMLPVTPRVRNFGKTPALEVSAFVQMFPVRPDENVSNRAREYCKGVALTPKEIHRKIGDIVPPGEPVIMPDDGSALSPQDFGHFKMREGNAIMITFGIYVRYRASWPDSPFYETCTIYTLTRTEGARKHRHFMVNVPRVGASVLGVERCAGGFAT